MNRDYAYCVGVNFFKEKAPTICKNCKRYIPWSEPVEDTLIWVAPQYDEKMGTCPLMDKKDKGNENNT